MTFSLMWCQTFATINWNCLLYVLQRFYIIVTIHTIFQILVVKCTQFCTCMYLPCFMTWHSGVAKYLLYMCISNDWKLKECKMEKEWCITREMNGNIPLAFWFENCDFAISSFKVTSLKTLSCLKFRLWF